MGDLYKTGYQETYIDNKNMYLGLIRHQSSHNYNQRGGNNTFRISFNNHKKKLEILFRKFFKQRSYSASKIIKYNKNIKDGLIYNKLSRLYKHDAVKHKSKQEYIEHREMIARKKLVHLEPCLNHYRESGFNHILDIGCEDCFQVKEIAKYLGIQNKHCINIENWNDSGYGLPRDDCNYTVYDGVNVPFNDGFFNVVIMFQTMHHIPGIEQYMEGVRRVLAPGGLLIIREHDCDTESMARLIDIEHGLYGVIVDGNKKFFKSYYGDYRGIEGWDKVIGMERIFIKKFNTPTNYYFAVYKK